MDTREKLINLMFAELYTYGYQGSKLNQIVEKSNLTKGAMYHHFKSKKELALTTIEEIFFNFIEIYWATPLKDNNTLDKLIELMQNLPEAKIKNNYIFDFKLGCPLNNLIQEMAHIDDDFTNLLQKVFFEWREVVATVIQKAIDDKLISNNLNSKDIATFIIASLEGSITIGKISNSKDEYLKSIEQIEFYLKSLLTKS